MSSGRANEDAAEVLLDKLAIEQAEELLFRVVMDCLSQHPSVSIPAACGGWTETIAAYRFFGNDRVTEQEGLKPHQHATLERIREQSVVLLVQDPTEAELRYSDLGTYRDTLFEP